MFDLSNLTPAVFLIFKALVILALAVYLLFSLIFWQKVKLLSKIIETQVSPLIVLLSFLNLLTTAIFLAAAFFFI